LTAVFNNKAIQASLGMLYLLPTPTTVVATTTPGIVKELFENFYVDGDIRQVLKPTSKPWARLDANGFKAKIEQKPIKVNPNDGPEFICNYEDIGYTAESMLLDVDADKLADILSAVSGQILTTVKSATQAGRTTILGGGQTNLNRYIALYRFESRQAPGEFRNVLIPACTLLADGDTEYSKTKARTLKVKITAEASELLLDPITGKGVVWIEDYVTAPKG
jgi:hypothetical protein